MTGAPPVASPRLSLVPLAATLYWSTDLGLGELLIHHGEIFRLKLAENIQGVPKKICFGSFGVNIVLVNGWPITSWRNFSSQIGKKIQGVSETITLVVFFPNWTIISVGQFQMLLNLVGQNQWAKLF